MKEESKREKLKRSEGTPIDMSNFWKDRLKRESNELEARQKELEQEKERINQIKCPVCKSIDKIHHIKRDSNRVYGPGYSSWITEEYFICKSCGVHYSDIINFKTNEQ